jgi:hypothetical protein
MHRCRCRHIHKLVMISIACWATRAPRILTLHCRQALHTRIPIILIITPPLTMHSLHPSLAPSSSKITTRHHHQASPLPPLTASGAPPAGYMMVNYLMREPAPGKFMTVKRALRCFAQARPNGIYKHHYIKDLFDYHREQIPEHYPFPPVRPWAWS